MGIIIILIGLFLRFHGFTQPLWYDEMFSLYSYRLPLDQILSSWNPIFTVLAKVSVMILGDNALAIRLQAVIASLAGLWVAWILAGMFGLSRPRRIIALAVLAVLPYNVWMAQDGRSYALLALLYLALIYYALKGSWIGFVIIGTLLTFTHVVGMFYTVSGVAVLLLNHRVKIKSISWVVICISCVVLSMALVGVGLVRSSEATRFANSVTPDNVLNSLTHATIVNGPYWLLLSWSVALLIGVGIVLPSAVKAWRDPVHVSLALAAWLPLIGFILAGLVYKNVILYRTLSPMIAPLVIWIIYWIPKRWYAGVWALSMAAMLLYGVWLDPAGDKAGNGFGRSINYIRDNWQSGDVIYHATGTTALTYGYYLQGYPAYTVDIDQSDSLTSQEAGRVFGLSYAGVPQLREYNRIWIVWAHHPQINPEVDNIFRDLTAEAVLVGRVDIWQLAPVEIWIKDKGLPSRSE
jgi:hypothetical protein